MEDLKEVQSKSINTLRRTPIADTISQKQTAKQSEAQVQFTENISNNVDQSRKEQKDILEKIHEKETAVAVNTRSSSISSQESILWQKEQLKTLDEISDELSEKMVKFSELLKEKQSSAVKADETTSSALLGPEPEKIKPPELPLLIEPVNKPSEELVSKPKEDHKDSTPDDDVKGAPGKDPLNPLISGINTVTNVLKDGFKKSTSIADKIAGTLFKFTVSRAIEAAKMAAIVFSLILAIDVLKIMWQKWGADIMAKLEDWGEMFKSWWEDFKAWTNYFTDFASIFDTMAGDWTAIREAWESGDWPALAKAIGIAFLDSIKVLIGAIQRIGSKLIAEMLKALGFKDAGEEVEAAGLEKYQEMTGNELNEENSKKVAALQQKRESEGPSLLRGITNTISNVANPIGAAKGIAEISSWIRGDGPKKTEYSNMPVEDQKKIISARNEANSAIDRTINFSNKDIDFTNPTTAKTLQDKIQEANTLINSKELDKTPIMKSQLQKRLNDGIKNNVSPQSSLESPDVQLANSIKSNEAKPIVQSPSTSTANINTTNIKNSRNVSMTAPVTSSRAPGIFHATGVN